MSQNADAPGDVRMDACMSVATTQSWALRYFERVPMTTPAVSPLKCNTFLHALPGGDVWAKRPPADIQCLGGAGRLSSVYTL